MCQGLSYNQTITPNLLGHSSQREAAMKMSFFNSMAQSVCSVDIRLFLCMVYAPQCVAGEVQRPCRSFCDRAKKGCEGLMRSYGVSWPEELHCEAFPQDMCIMVRHVLLLLLIEWNKSNLQSEALWQLKLLNFMMSSFCFMFTGRQQTRGKDLSMLKTCTITCNVQYKCNQKHKILNRNRWI